MTERRLQLLHFIRNHEAHFGRPPTFRQMREAMDVASNETINEFLRALEGAGYIRREQDGNRRVIKLTRRAIFDEKAGKAASQQNMENFVSLANPLPIVQNYSISTQADWSENGWFIDFKLPRGGDG